MIVRSTPRPRALGALPLVALAVLAGGCGERFAKVVERHRPAMEAAALAAERIGEAARMRPRLERDDLAAPVPLRLHLTQTSVKDANALAVYWEDLAQPEELGYVVARVPGTRRLADCASYVRRGHTAFDPAEPARYLSIPFGFTAEDALAECTRVRYLVVLRTVAFVPPGTPVHAAVQASAGVGPAASSTGATPVGAPDASTDIDAGAPDGGPRPAASGAASPTEDTWSFEGGQVELEVLVYELASGRDLGGFLVAAENSPVFDGTDVVGDLRKNLARALEQGLAQRAPGALGGG